jgi:quercetin dioxygenase-like cupin family protein
LTVASFRSLRLVALLAILGCAAERNLLLPEPPAAVAVRELARRDPLPKGVNIRPVEIDRADHTSVHLVQIREGERPHVHTRYDLTVVLVKGRGTLTLSGRPLPMREGDVAFIPRETPHFFVNQGREPAAALVVFSPAFGGPDSEPVR